MSKTMISWTDEVWNPVTGCTKVSDGCKNCYAKTVHDMRMKAYKQGKKVPMQYSVPFEEIMLHGNRLYKLFAKKTNRVFVNSMSDLFHEKIPDEYIAAVLAMTTVKDVEQKVFQVLTKRAARMKEVILKYGCYYGEQRTVLNNVWLGVTAENQQTADGRIPLLLDTPAAVRWVSIEPMLEEMDMQVFLGNYNSCDGYVPKLLDWVVVGCESGTNRRPCKIEWIENVVEQCQNAGVAVFVKQIELNGKVESDIEKFPEHLKVREFPNE